MRIGICQHCRSPTITQRCHCCQISCFLSISSYLSFDSLLVSFVSRPASISSANSCTVDWLTLQSIFDRLVRSVRFSSAILHFDSSNPQALFSRLVRSSRLSTLIPKSRTIATIMPPTPIPMPPAIPPPHFAAILPVDKLFFAPDFRGIQSQWINCVDIVQVCWIDTRLFRLTVLTLIFLCVCTFVANDRW